jgi:hypothetical protein
MKYDLNEDNFDILVAKFYVGKFWTNEELENDIQRIKYVKRLIGKYVRKGELNDRLILNHIIILSNVFGPEFATKILFFRIDPKHYPILKTFLLFLNYLPDKIQYINGKIIDTTIIPVDMKVANCLRKIDEESITNN